MNVEQCIADQIRASISTKQAILSDKGLMRNIAAAAQMIVDAYEQGKKTLLAGNGGSAADAQQESLSANSILTGPVLLPLR